MVRLTETIFFILLFKNKFNPGIRKFMLKNIYKNIYLKIDILDDSLRKIGVFKPDN